MNKKIKYSENQYITVTDGSFKLANIISADVASALIAEGVFLPAVLVLVAFFSPLRATFATAFSSWVSAIAFRIGQTNRVNELLASLSAEKIDDWDVAVRGIFRKGTSDYLSIFPSGREPFQHGGIDERIREVDALLERLTNPALAAVLADVTAFQLLLSNARDTQQQLEETVQIKSAALEKARIDVCNGLFYVTGGLMQVFYNDPNQMNRFFPLDLIVSSGSGDNDSPTPGQTATGIVNMNEVKNLFLDGFTGASVVQIKNLGLVPLQFYTVSGPNLFPMPGSQTINPGEVLEISIDQINQPVGQYFNVFNSSPSQGKYEVSILSI